MKWDYFVLRRAQDGYGEAHYYKGDTKETVCPPNVEESEVLNIFGLHGYELVAVQTTRTGDTKYFLKRAKA